MTITKQVVEFYMRVQGVLDFGHGFLSEFKQQVVLQHWDEIEYLQGLPAKLDMINLENCSNDLRGRLVREVVAAFENLEVFKYYCKKFKFRCPDVERGF